MELTILDKQLSITKTYQNPRKFIFWAPYSPVQTTLPPWVGVSTTEFNGKCVQISGQGVAARSHDNGRPP